MKKALLLVLGLCSMGAWAEEFYWGLTSKADGTYDISDPANWGGTLPGPEDKFYFGGTKSRDYTFTMSVDMTLSALPFGVNTRQKLTLDLGAERTLTLLGNKSKDASVFNFNNNNSVLTLKSGTIVATNTTEDLATTSIWPKFFLVNAWQTNNQIFVSGPNTRVFIDAVKMVGGHSLFCVTNGAYVKGEMFIVHNTSTVLSNVTLQVTGAGSQWVMNDFIPAAKIGGLTMHVNESARAILLGSSKPSVDNSVLLKVDNGGVVSNFTAAIGRTGGARVLVDNGTIYLRDHINMAYYQGEKPVTSNVFEIVNGGKVLAVDCPDDTEDVPTFRIGRYGAWNRLTIGTNAVMDMTSAGYLHIGSSTDNSRSNVLEIVDGGRLIVNKLQVNGFSQRLRLHNGQVKAFSKDQGFYDNSQAIAKGVVEISGRDSHFETPSFVLRQLALKLILPPQGFAAPVIEATKQISFGLESSLVVDARATSPGVYKLLRCTPKSGLSIKDTVLAAAEVTPPKGCVAQLSIADGELLLTVKRRQLLIVIR